MTWIRTIIEWTLALVAVVIGTLYDLLRRMFGGASL